MRSYKVILLSTTYIVVQIVSLIHSIEVQPVDVQSDIFSEKLDWNKVKMTKLRLLLLGELFKHQQTTQNDVV